MHPRPLECDSSSLQRSRIPFSQSGRFTNRPRQLETRNFFGYRRANGPRSNCPGSAPVCSLLRSTTSPATIVAMMPVAFCFKRRAPAGKSYSSSGIIGAMVSGLKTTMSAFQPSRSKRAYTSVVLAVSLTPMPCMSCGAAAMTFAREMSRTPSQTWSPSSRHWQAPAPPTSWCRTCRTSA